MSAFSTENEIESIVVNNKVIENVYKDVIRINGGKKGLGKDQDLVYFGECEDYKWGVLLDCHGTFVFKDLLKRQNWDEIMKHDRPDLELIRIIKLEPTHYGFVIGGKVLSSGSTMSMMKIYGDRIETFNIGDSYIMIYKNGELVYMSSPHNPSNPIEKVRLETMNNVIIEPTKHKIPFMLDGNTMGLKFGEYCLFNYGELQLSPSQALGHNHITGYNPEVHIEPYSSTDIIRVLSCSDGVMDMVLLSSDNEADVKQDDNDMKNMNVNEILEKSEKRWKQNWKIFDDETNKYIINHYEPDMYDDISVIIFEKLFIDTSLEKV